MKRYLMMQSSLQSGKISKIRYLIIIVCVIVLSYYISADWYQLSLVRGESMSPSYHNMQFVMIDRHFRDYTYGDVIVFHCSDLDAVLVKRIAACPGDVVMIKDGTLFVNGTVSSVYGQKNLFEYPGIARESLYLGEGQYFVIGDNIKESRDSRYDEVGSITIADIIGRVIPNVEL